MKPSNLSLRSGIPAFPPFWVLKGWKVTTQGAGSLSVLSLRAVVLSLQLLQQGHQNTDCWAPPSVFLNQQVWAAPLMTCISEQNPKGYNY